MVDRVEISVTIDKLTRNQALANQDAQPSEELGLTVENITPYLAENLMLNPLKVF